jgi:prevent-host-death family protein
MKTYSIEEARAILGDLVLAAAAGKSSLLTYHGVPAARITSLPARLQFTSDTDSATATETHKH